MIIPAEPLAEPSRKRIGRATILKSFAAIFVITIILRIAYSGHLFEDDGLWFTAGEELLRGKSLYREIYFDKPPGLALVYAVLFWVFGAHILTIRLFTILYAVAVSGFLYWFGSRLYNQRTGLIAAAMFAIFSTTYSTGHFQGLNTDFLMVLPYTVGAYFLADSRKRSSGNDRTKAGWLAVTGGALAGVAFQINPKAVLDLAFFGVILGVSRWLPKLSPGRRAGAMPPDTSISALRLFGLAVTGFVAGALPFLLYIVWTDSLGGYFSYVWDWGARYGAYYSFPATLLATLTRSADYFAVNNTLLVALIFVVASLLFRRRRPAVPASAAALEPESSGTSITENSDSEADAVLIIWFVVSFAGVMLGGRLFPHYLYQVLPGLCLIGARGVCGMSSKIKSGGRPYLGRAAAAVLILGFVFTLVRFHGRSVLLLADLARGTRSEANANWYYEQRKSEELLVAAAVTGARDGDSTRSRNEAVREGGPRYRPANDSPDYLFVWGYRPEIYYWSGLLPASRYLSTQPLTGVPADVHYFGDDYQSLVPVEATAQARAELVRDLNETRPKYIVDELGFFNSNLSIQSYSELREFMTAYKPLGTTGRFFIYIRKEFSKRNRERRAEPH